MLLRARFVVGLSAAALVLAGCAGGESSGGGSSSDSGGSSEGEASSADVCESADGDGPKIGLAYDVGGRGDQSFNDSAYAGLKQVVTDLDGTCTEAEAQNGEDEAAREERLRQLAEAGHETIVAVGFIYGASVYTVAPDYPEVNFGIIDGAPPEGVDLLPNVANIGFAANQGSFLVGAAAALTTESDSIGFVGGLDIPLIQDFELGYVAGAEEVNPDVEIESQYLSQDDAAAGFENPSGGNTTATGMYDKGADVVFHAAGKSGLGVFDAAVTAGEGNWAIGVDSDQYLTASPEQQPRILTSMLKRVDVGVIEYVTGVADAAEGGEAPNGFVTYDLASDGVGYATSGDFLSQDVLDQLEELKQQIIDGDIKVPSAFE
ncbi:MAG: BMP family ABC transporter substrate-binding protein [Actinomycetota bacterium]|nr:BMP family ABC transporter substrate-binding protein [Actinomycetota bacterium]